MTRIRFPHHLRALAGCLLLIVSAGCPEESSDQTPLGGNSDTTSNLSNTPSSTPQIGSSSSSGSTARCNVSSQTVPQMVPLQAASPADDTFGGFGDNLNAFWKLNTCLFNVNPNGFQQVYHNAISFYPPSAVIYDASLFAEWSQTWGNDVPALTFLAHEWGHQVQYSKGLSFQYTIQAENDADTRAGYFIGALAQQAGTTNLTEIVEFLRSFGCSIGDSQNVPWFDQNAHGTCDQRAEAMIKGFNQAVSTSTVGRAGLSNPSASAAATGTWTGRVTVNTTLVASGTIQATDMVPLDYVVQISSDGKVLDDDGFGPFPAVGESKSTPVQGNSLDFIVNAKVTAFSYDDNASRYDWSLSVDGGTAGGVPVTGTGFETDVFKVLPDGGLNLYSYISLTLTGNTGNSVELVLETSGRLTKS